MNDTDRLDHALLGPARANRRDVNHGHAAALAFHAFAIALCGSSAEIGRRIQVHQSQYSRAISAGKGVTTDQVLGWIDRWNQSGSPKLSLLWSSDGQFVVIPDGLAHEDTPGTTAEI